MNYACFSYIAWRYRREYRLQSFAVLDLTINFKVNDKKTLKGATEATLTNKRVIVLASQAVDLKQKHALAGKLEMSSA